MEIVKPIIEFKDVCVSYTRNIMAVKHVSASVEKNTITAIMGPSADFSNCISTHLFFVFTYVYAPYCSPFTRKEPLLSTKTREVFLFV